MIDGKICESGQQYFSGCFEFQNLCGQNWYDRIYESRSGDYRCVYLQQPPQEIWEILCCNMLAAYYSKGADSEKMFSDLSIGKTQDFKKYLNKYDVIHIDIQWFLANCEDKNKVVQFITKSVLDELREIYPECLIL